MEKGERAMQKTEQRLDIWKGTSKSSMPETTISLHRRSFRDFPTWLV